ncbi:MAG: hypothetical protein ACFE9D_05510 [Promethearchaeota archaeon]
MPRLHIFLDSPASNELTKTELDIGIVTRPYVAIAHCIRAGFCISHALRDWVRITIGFTQLEPYSLTLDPTTIRYLGTDERSILHIILRAQEAYRRSKVKMPYGVTIHEEPFQGLLKTSLNQEGLLLIPDQTSSWRAKISEFSKFAMYCPLSKVWDPIEHLPSEIAFYHDFLARDIAILELVHALDQL